ncbi:MAG: glutamate-1-semialdehyde 2,1-aminomutase [Caldisericia bacterium]|nr:glutamate-1-semialdehyde 2,1-aminomutase [Caldisericia bacterium]MDD4615006.1 glutamate-1-semialdehyde 2,1-aminomutase [Caldisericia bacterium]
MNWKNDESNTAFQRALQILPGGVNSPVRAWKHMDMDPVIIERANGSKIYDIDGNEYIDYIASYGPLILGHAHPSVVNAIQSAAKRGTTYGSTSLEEIDFCQEILEAFPAMDKIRLVNSGTEATMSAIRLARAYTQRDLILKFEGCYHGHADPFLMKAGSGLLTERIPSSPGVPLSTAQCTLNASFNNFEQVETLFQHHGSHIAAIIVEPFPANMGLLFPKEKFLQMLREITIQYGSLLILDEVISGFRFCYGGLQSIVGIEPDITTLGKIIGGGLPIGAYGGREEIMNLIAPQGSVYQAGTLSGNPIAVAAGRATLMELKNQPTLYDDIQDQTKTLTFGLDTILQNHGIPHILHSYGSVFSLFLTNASSIDDYNDVLKSNETIFSSLFTTLIKRGIMIAPSPYEVSFVSAAHTQLDINNTLISWEEAVTKWKQKINV